MPYPREYCSKDSILKLFNKKILYVGPNIKIDEKFVKCFSKYDYIMTINFTFDRMFEILGENTSNHKFIRVCSGLYSKDDPSDGTTLQPNTIHKYDNFVDFYFFSSVERLNHETCNKIDKNKCFFLYPNAHLQGLESATTGIQCLGWFLRNKIKITEMKITGFTFRMELFNFLVKENSTNEEIEKILKLRNDVIKSNNVPMEYVDYYVGYNSIDRFCSNVNCYQKCNHSFTVDYNFFLKFLTYYNTNTEFGNIKVDNTIKNIIKEYNYILPEIKNDVKYLINYK